MTVQVQDLESLKKKITITVPSDEVKQRYQTQLQKEAKKLKMDGFRQGKVPLNIAEKHVGPAVWFDVTGQLMETYYQKAITDEKLPIAGPPEKVDRPEKVDLANDFQFSVEVECFPDIKLKELKKEKVTKLTGEVTEADIDKMVENVRGQHKEWKAVDRESKNGDQVDIDFEGFIQDTPFEGGKAEHHKLELGSNSMIPGFEEGIVGMKAGDTKTIPVTFPEKYHQVDLAGKKAMFKIKVHAVEEPALPELNDQFIQEKLGFKDGNMAMLREKLRRNMEFELKQRLKDDLKKKVLDKLLEVNKIEVPVAAINTEISNMQQQTRQRMAQQFGQNAKEISKLELPRDLYEEEAKRRVALGMLFSEVIKQHEIKADEDKVKSYIEELAAPYDNPQEVIDYYSNNPNMKQEIEAVVLEDLAVEKLLENAKVNEEAASYDDVMQRQQEGS